MTSLVSHGVRFPPVCGGGPTCWPSSSVTQPDSPVVRGWTDVMPSLGGIVQVFPRRAGVDRSGGSNPLLNSGFPPACGGGPVSWLTVHHEHEFSPACGGGPISFSASRFVASFSPGVRGWTVRVHAVEDRPACFPPACGGGPSQ